MRYLNVHSKTSLPLGIISLNRCEGNPIGAVVLISYTFIYLVHYHYEFLISIPILDKWVYKPHGRWYRYLPRRNDAAKEFDYESEGVVPESFPEKVHYEICSIHIVF